MVSRIIFLGTGGDNYVYSKQYRGSGGIILDIGEKRFIIDPGPGALVKAAQNNINIRETTAILVSHSHLGHSNDVNAMIDAMTYSGLDRKGILISSKSFVNGAEGISPGLSTFHKNCVEKIMILESGKRIGIENVEIEALPTQHLDSDTIGFKFYTPDFVLSYSSDTKYFSDLLNVYEGSDILILNITNPGNEKSDKLNIEDANKIISKIKPKLAVITHFGIKLLKEDPILHARDIQMKTGIQTVAAKDGMIITPGIYSANSKQKTLLDLDKYKQKSTDSSNEIEIKEYTL